MSSGSALLVVAQCDVEVERIGALCKAETDEGVVAWQSTGVVSLARKIK